MYLRLLNRGLCPYYGMHNGGRELTVFMNSFLLFFQRGASRRVWCAFFISYAPAESWVVSALQRAPTAAFRGESAHAFFLSNLELLREGADKGVFVYICLSCLLTC